MADEAKAATTPALSLLERFPATPAGHIAFLEFVRDEVRGAAEANIQQLQYGYSNDTLASMIRSVKWAEAKVRFAALTELSGIQSAFLNNVLERPLTVGSIEQIDGILTPAIRALRNGFEDGRISQLVKNIVVV